MRNEKIIFHHHIHKDQTEQKTSLYWIKDTVKSRIFFVYVKISCKE